MRTRLLITTLLLLVGFCASASGQKCLDYGATVSLTGTLRSQVFPGPPNYESVRRGDRKETAIILKLVTSACTAGSDPQGVDVPESNISEMQLVIVKKAHWKLVRRLMGQYAIVTGTLFHAHTGHHRTKVLVNVASIRAAVIRWTPRSKYISQLD